MLTCAALAACDASTDAGAVRFVDVAAQAGLTLPHAHRGGPTQVAAAYTGGAAVGDWDGDADPDLVLTRFAAPAVLYRNRGDGTFEDVTAASGLATPVGNNGVAWGDLDGDGDLDLLVGTVGGTQLLLYVNDGGTFTEQAAARGIALDDGVPHSVFSFAVGDYDRDGWLDVHTSEWPEPAPGTRGHTRLFRNRGAAAPGTFDDVTEDAGIRILFGGAPSGFTFTPAFVDLDDDGWTDIAIAADYHRSRLFWSRGDGTFEDGTSAAGVGTDDSGMGSAFADLDGDGRLDWFVSAIDATDGAVVTGTGNRLYLNLGGRRFEDVATEAGVLDGGWGWGVAPIDPDADGDLDLVLTNGWGRSGRGEFEHDPMRFFVSSGSARFVDEAARVGLTDTEQGRALVVLDFDLDGDEDLLVVRNGDVPLLYRADGPERRAWLRVAPRARRGGAPCAGVRVTVTVAPSSPPLVREIVAGGTYLGQHEPVAHFGLGDAASVTEVRVRWSSGRELVLRDVATRQRLDVLEPE